LGDFFYHTCQKKSILLLPFHLHNLALSALGASVIFFIVSNFGVWFSGVMYPKDLSGLVACYVAGIPFFQNTVLGDLFYSAILFGVFELSVRKVPKLAIN